MTEPLCEVLTQHQQACKNKRLPGKPWCLSHLREFQRRGITLEIDRLEKALRLAKALRMADLVSFRNGP